MTDKGLNVDNKVHELKFGSSFDPKSRVAVHSIRYDFKPASVDTTKDSLVEIGEGHHVTLTVPHVEGSGKTHTVYKGNKRPVSKECVLIIDHDTGTFTLERLSNTIQLKKTRTENSSKAQSAGRPLTPVDYNKQKTSPGKPKTSASPSPPGPRESPSATPKIEKDTSPIGHISDTSSSESDLSDSDSDHDSPTGKGGKPLPGSAGSGLPQTTGSSADKYMSIISTDLRLTDTSDSDSD